MGAPVDLRDRRPLQKRAVVFFRPLGLRPGGANCFSHPWVLSASHPVFGWAGTHARATQSSFFNAERRDFLPPLPVTIISPGGERTASLLLFQSKCVRCVRVHA